MQQTLKKSYNAVRGLTYGVIVFWLLLLWFPGGTIWMAVWCRAWRLAGLDWVLSVIIPGYGFVFGITCM